VDIFFCPGNVFFAPFPENRPRIIQRKECDPGVHEYICCMTHCKHILLSIFLLGAIGSAHAQTRKYEYLKFSVIALDAKQFQSAKQCRTITDKALQNQIAHEMIDSLTSVMKRQELIDRYIDYYSVYPILAVIYTKHIVNLALSEQRDSLKSFIEKSDTKAAKDQYEEICTGYINMRSSLLFQHCGHIQCAIYLG